MCRNSVRGVLNDRSSVDVVVRRTSADPVEREREVVQRISFFANVNVFFRMSASSRR